MRFILNTADSALGPGKLSGTTASQIQRCYTMPMKVKCQGEATDERFGNRQQNSKTGIHEDSVWAGSVRPEFILPCFSFFSRIVSLYVAQLSPQPY